MDILIQYKGNPDILKKYESYSVHIMNETYAVIYLPMSMVTPRLLSDFGYSSIPKCYALTEDKSLEASGVNKLRSIPVTNLRGNGVLIGIIDTGIDYTNQVFQHEDGTSKIVSIWDQSIESTNGSPNAIYPTFYGTEYTSEQINQALKSNNPLEIVPSKDENGHGTMLAGIAAGSENKENNFSGVVPDSELIVVKLKQAKNNLKDFFAIPQNVPCFQKNDIIWAMQYLLDVSRRINRPLAICIGLGTSQGSHDNFGFLNTEVSLIGDFPGIAVSISAGNEGNLKRHFFSVIDTSTDYIPVELNVGENESGFSMELWGDPPMIYTLDILSPTGEYVTRLTVGLQERQVISFLFEQTVISIDYVMIEQETGKQIIILRFRKPSHGVWKFGIYGKGDLKGAFHIWLPSGNFISQNTYFTSSDPFTTITSPGNCIVPITVTAYDSTSNVFYINSGRGFSTSNIINPNLTAPGVNITCPSIEHTFISATGTSAAAAHTTGITAILLEWCIVQKNYPGIDTIGIKNFLIRGANRSPNLTYPNQEWGYGTIDLYNTFDLLRIYV